MCPDRIRGISRPSTSSDTRSEFEKDYQRIISSASFRRLQDKTQVFPLDKSDFIRTRLTHSLEVANFARSIGRMIGNRIIEEKADPAFDVAMRDDICSVLECAGLLHDIGNPPFGHFGEDAIRDWFRRNLKEIDYKDGKLYDALTEQQRQDFCNFEGNTQALRVVTRLHFIVDENGMNLTKALLATIMKYPCASTQIKYDKKDPDRDIARKKMGYFAADADIFDSVQEGCGTNGRRHPLAFALEAADDIAYRTADIEDAVKKGLLDVAMIQREIGIAIDKAKERKSPESVIKEAQRALNRLEYYDNKAKERGVEGSDLYAVQNWVVRIQGTLLTDAVNSFMDNYDSIMKGEFRKELLADTPGGFIADTLGDIAYRYAFISEPILKLEVAADAIFDFLLERLVKALRYFDTDEWDMHACAVDRKMVAIISSTFMQIYRIHSEGKSENEKIYLRLLLATDYVSGMTDSYAKRLYRELRGID